jgi:Putative DnaT-like ssDNA binding protein
MAIIVEDGTGKTDANSYASVAEANAYFANRPSQDAVWDNAGSAEKQEALILATAYLDAEYGGQWAGTKRTMDQALDWPRTDAVTTDGHSIEISEIPARLKRATFELAVLSSPVGTTTLLTTIANPAAGIQRIKVKADVVERDITYSGAGAEQQAKYPVVDGILRELIGGGSGTALRRSRG